MKRIKEYLNDDSDHLNYKDYLALGIIVLLYGVLSFINLGSFSSPNTFYRSEKLNEIVLELEDNENITRFKSFNGEKNAIYNMYISSDGLYYSYITGITGRGAFSWNDEEISAEGKYVKFIFTEDSSLGEVAFYNNKKQYIKINNVYDSNGNKIDLLNDEIYSIPEKVSYMNSTYFDEIYFARTAYEYVNNISTYEWTHPPLGKLIQAIPIFITNRLSPFNYRFMGNIAGILMIIVMYFFGKELFKKRKFALLSSLIMTLDTFHFVQTRMGTVDSHLVLFILLASYYMIKFINRDKIMYLFLSGLFFGVSVSVKWSGLYGGIALAIIYFIYLFRNKKFNIRYILYGLLFFVIVPLIIYCSCYLLFPNNLLYTNNLKNIIEEQKIMYNYHSNLDAEHFFSSKWYTWPISYKPVWYYSQDFGSTRGTISGLGNIIIWIFGIFAFLYSLIKCIFKKDRNSFIIILFIISLWFPYIFIGRIMFLYHYFPVLPFIMLASVNVFCDFDLKKAFKYILPIYLVLSFMFFVIYYPVISGLHVNEKYIERLKVFDEWYF